MALGEEGTTSFQLPMPHPQEAQIRGLNEQRLARRRAAEAAAEDFGRVGFDELRRGPRREVGGMFPTMLEVPERQPMPELGLGEQDLAALLEAFTFGPRMQTLGTLRQTVTGPLASGQGVPHV